MFDKEEWKKSVSRYGFFRNIFMMGGLFASYGTLALLILKYLAPRTKKEHETKMFVGLTTNLKSGSSISFETPEGESYILTGREDGSGVKYIAFSNGCPHLGCKVIWNNAENKFHCPCHNGIFNDEGVAISGPPSKAGQRLKKCAIKVEDKAIYALLT